MAGAGLAKTPVRVLAARRAMVGKCILKCGWWFDLVSVVECEVVCGKEEEKDE